MKIAVISDTHLGFDYSGERSDDSFIAAEEAIDKAIAEKVDLIILPGDLFDSRVPKPDVFVRAMRIFSKPLVFGHSNVRLVENDKYVSKLSLIGIPMIAIHGTHERRATDLMNPIEALEHAGIMIHLHLNHVVFEKHGERIAIHGMSGVPERYAGPILKDWNPKPVKDAVNILMLHQSIDPFIYSPNEPPTIKLEDLPDGFDLYIDGHIHERKIHEFDLAGHKRKLLICGSTIQTQLKKESRKGFNIISVENGKIGIKFIELENQRDVYIFDINNEKELKQTEEFLRNLPAKKLKPVVRIKLNKDIDDTGLKTIQADAIVSITKNVKEEMKIKKINVVPIEELGIKILEERAGPLAEVLFDMLLEGKIDESFSMLFEKYSEESK